MTSVPACVIVPMFNDAQHIARCLLSLSGQSRPPEEIILVDNASTDGSVDVAEALGLPNLRIIRNGANLGASAARNSGIDNTAQPYLVFLDSDDFLSADALELAFKEIGPHSMCLFREVLTRADGKTVFLERQRLTGVLTGDEAFNQSVPFWNTHARAVFSREVAMKARTFFRAHGHADDEVLFRLLLAESTTVTGCDGIYYYRINHRPITFEKAYGQTRSNIRSAQLAEERLGAGFTHARPMRDRIARNLLGLLARAARGEGSLADVRRLHEEAQGLRSSRSFKARLMDLAIGAATSVHHLVSSHRSDRPKNEDQKLVR